MFSLLGSSSGFTRRELLRVGGLSPLALSAADLAHLRASTPETPTNQRRRRNSCVLFFLFGGPSQIDLWDMKPAAPEQVRGEFRPTATTVSGIRICEYLPRLG